MYTALPDEEEVDVDSHKARKARKIWIQNSIDEQRRMAANVRSRPWPMAKKKQELE